MSNIKMFDLNSLVGIFVLGSLGWLIYKVHIWPYYISPLRNIPGPPSDNPFYGNFKSLFLEEVNIVFESLIWQFNLVKYYGTLKQSTVLVADTKIIQKLR